MSRLYTLLAPSSSTGPLPILMGPLSSARSSFPSFTFPFPFILISLVPLPAPPGMRGQPTIQPVAVLCNPMNAVFVTSVQAGLEKNHETFVLNLPHEGKVTLLASTRHLLITASSNGTVRLYPTDCALLRGKTPAPDARPYRERVASMALEVKEPYFFGFNAHEGSVGSVKGRVGNGETGDCGNGRLVTGGDDGHVRWVIT